MLFRNRAKIRYDVNDWRVLLVISHADVALLQCKDIEDIKRMTFEFTLSQFAFGWIVHVCVDVSVALSALRLIPYRLSLPCRNNVDETLSDYFYTSHTQRWKPLWCTQALAHIALNNGRKTKKDKWLTQNALNAVNVSKDMVIAHCAYEK